MSDTSKIRQTIKAVSECLEALKINAEKIKVYLEDDTFIEQELISDTVMKLSELSNFEDELKKSHSELFPGEKCSDLLSDIVSETDVYESVAEARRARGRANYILIIFKSIRSEIDECQKALGDYYAKLKKLAKRSVQTEGFLEALKPYEDFYRSVEGSVEDKISFSKTDTFLTKNVKLMLHLIQGDLYIDYSAQNELEFLKNRNEPLQLSFDNIFAEDEAPVNLKEDYDNIDFSQLVSESEFAFEYELISGKKLETETKKEKPAKQETEAVPEEKEEAPLLSFTSGEAPLVSEVSSSDNVTEETHDAVSESENKDISEEDETDLTDTSALKSAGIAVRVRDEYKNISIENNDNGEMPSVKVFKKDMSKFLNGNAFFICWYRKLICLDPVFLDEAHVIANQKPDYSAMTESLLKSGYIQKLMYENRECYILTDRCRKCISDKSYVDWIKKVVKVQKLQWVQDDSCAPGTPVLSGIGIVPLQNYVLTRLGYCYIVRFVKLFHPKAACTCSESFSSCSYSGVYQYGKHKTNVFALSCFPDSENSARGLINNIEELLLKNDYGDIEIALLASDDLEQCTAIRNYLKSVYPQFANTFFFGCCIKENVSYDIATGEQHSIKELLEQADLYHKTKFSSSDCTFTAAEFMFKDSVKVTDQNSNKSADTPENGKSSGEEKTEPVSDQINGEDEGEKKVSDSVYGDLSEKYSVISFGSKGPLKEIADILEESESRTDEDEDGNDKDAVMTFPPEIYGRKLSFTYEDVIGSVFTMINYGREYCASAYLGACGDDQRTVLLKEQLGLALNAPDKNGVYLSDVVMNIFSEVPDDDAGRVKAFSGCLMACAGLRVLFNNTSDQDYGFRQMYSMIKESEILARDEDLVGFAGKLEEFRSENRIGIDAVADYRIKESKEAEKLICNITKEAKELYDRNVVDYVKEKTTLTRYIDMRKMIFKTAGELPESLKIAADNRNDEASLEFVRNFVYGHFIADGIEIKPENVRKSNIDDYIDEYWEEAGKIQREKQLSKKLANELRSNIVTCVTKIVNVICSWYSAAGSSVSVPVQSDFEKEKNAVRAYLEKARKSTDRMLKIYRGDEAMLAGYHCIDRTLAEFDAKLSGRYNENESRYYYADFLKYGDVMLDDSFLPDFSQTMMVRNTLPFECVIRHANRPDRSFEERTDEIFYRLPSSTDDKMGDDYGCAALIKEYLLDHGMEWDDEKNNIEANTEEAFRQFKSDFENFVGSLEFCQYCGQIDNDRKEHILAVVNLQYIKTENTHNFGYFSRFLDFIEKSVKNDAKHREKALNDELETVISECENSEQSERFVREAREMIVKQNYTVVEDLINRIRTSDYEDYKAGTGADSLQSFITDYHANYRIVGTTGVNFKRLVQTSGRRFTDGGSELIENFLTASGTNAERIKDFVSALGFRAVNVTEDEKAEMLPLDSYSIETVISPMSGKEGFTHSVSPFGSLAAENGFRVLCLYGSYDARKLIDIFRKAGTSRHTVVLLDHALNLPERRALARKIKEEISDSVFIVIDRVLAYYLACHYDETSVNRVLMETTMPFASFQPYSSNQTDILPSEMFTGRKEQLTDIISPSGANLICGVHGFGKSVLLRMAKEMTDGNGDRAVYVEVKGCDCRQTAEKISAALAEAHILDEGYVTSDWSELARTLKKRIYSSDEDEIPYLLLLVDDADKFTEDCRNCDYAPVDALEDIQSFDSGRFKFVLSVFRDPSRFETGESSAVGHLTKLTLKPFKYSEARELLEKPMYCLGVRFPEDKAYLVSLILASTNYYPALIQFYCSKLVEAVKKYDPVFNENTSPPYEVSAAHIKSVIADPEFRNQLKEKFLLTLKNDSDSYFNIIMVLVAHFCYNESVSGCSVNDISKLAGEFGISCISTLDTEKVGELMNDLCELNILRKDQNEKYLFARFSFLEFLGNPDEIDDLILMYSEEA